jgi:hypothetical protein
MKILAVILASVMTIAIYALPLSAMDKQIFGWVERVRIQPGNVLLEAKLDSGAEYSSLDATNITEFERQGEKWVRFDLNHRQGKAVSMEGKLIRYAPIKRHYGKSQRRPVIRLRLCLGNYSAETQINLVDRTGFIYPLLIGRKFMEGHVIIDPNLKFTVDPVCKEQTRSE